MDFGRQVVILVASLNWSDSSKLVSVCWKRVEEKSRQPVTCSHFPHARLMRPIPHAQMAPHADVYCMHSFHFTGSVLLLPFTISNGPHISDDVTLPQSRLFGNRVAWPNFYKLIIVNVHVVSNNTAKWRRDIQKGAERQSKTRIVTVTWLK